MKFFDQNHEGRVVEIDLAKVRRTVFSTLDAGQQAEVLSLAKGNLGAFDNYSLDGRTSASRDLNKLTIGIFEKLGIPDFAFAVAGEIKVLLGQEGQTLGGLTKSIDELGDYDAELALENIAA
ncbi:MAG: hypothetical protein WCV72_01880 [Patescibacteria group bacterium]|jgi:hypothetical protein